MCILTSGYPQLNRLYSHICQMDALILRFNCVATRTGVWSEKAMASSSCVHNFHNTSQSIPYDQTCEYQPELHD